MGLLHFGGKKMKIFANYVVYNEELLLPLSIESIYEHVDGIVLIDNYSTDRTLEVIEPYRDKIMLFKSPSKDFSYLRNLALYASNDADFIIKLDADEIVYEDFAEAFRAISKQMLVNDLDFMQCWFFHMLNDLKTMHNQSPDGKDPTYQRTFMFRNNIGHVKWIGPVHEYLAGLRATQGIALDYFYLHLGYVKPPQEVFKRWQLYAELEGEAERYAGVDGNKILDGRLEFEFNHPLPKVLQKFLDEGGKLEWKTKTIQKD